jgi:hypothetical protein
MTFRLSIKESESTFDWSTTGKAFLSTLIMFITAFPFMHQSLVLTILVAVATYAIAIFATGAITKQMLTDLLMARKGTPEIGKMG